MRQRVITRRLVVGALALAVALVAWAPAGSGQFFQRLFRRDPAPASSLRPLVVDVLDVGQGDAILIRSPEGRTALIDAGLSKAVVERLEERGVTELDLVVVTHPHTDHFGGMDDVIQAFHPRYYLAAETSRATSSYLKLLKLVKEKGMTAVSPTDRPRKINLGSVVLTVLPQPPEDPHEQNNNSIGIRLQYGTFSMLMTGDSEEAERAWWMVHAPELLRDCEVLKLAHHGSHNGTDDRWLELVNPRVAVVSLGQGNTYGHPHAETLHRLESFKIPLYRTDRHGTITIRSDGRRWTIDEPRAIAGRKEGDGAVKKASGTPGSRARVESSERMRLAAEGGAFPEAPQDEEEAERGSKLDLNRASRSQLERIPGVGAASARRIMQARPFRSLDELDDLGLSQTALGELKKRTTVR